MDCETARDRFSSLWEKELSPLEEKVLEEHLSSCPKCREDFERFEKTMRWLHSVGEVDVPEGFLPDLYRKIEERKKAVPAEKPGAGRFRFPPSFRLPVQAVALVAVVFFVLYLTKMMPIDGHRLKEPRQTPPLVSMEKKSETGWAQNEVERERRSLERPAGIPRSKDVEQADVSVAEKGKREEPSVSQTKAEAKKTEVPAPRTEAVGYQTAASNEAAREKTPSPEPGKMEKGPSVSASKPPREIVLRISDREKVISRLHALVKQFGGEVVATEENTFIASLPTRSIPELERELSGFRSFAKTDQLLTEKQAMRSLGFGQGVKREEADEKSKGPEKLAGDMESRTIVRILLLQE